MYRFRICHLGKYYPPAVGGIETHVRTIAQAQAAMGMDVTVLCINHFMRDGCDETSAILGSTETDVEMDGKVRVIRVGRSVTLARFDICPRLPRTIRGLNRSQFDILHLHTPNPTMLLALAAWTGRGTPLVVTHHSDIVRQNVLKMALDPFERRVYARSEAVLASTQLYAAASEVLLRHSEKLQIVPLGLDLSMFVNPSAAALARAAALRAAHGEPLWLAVGRCVYYKGFETAIAALTRVPGKLIIIGEGPLQPRLRKQAQQLGVDNRVVWWGHASPDELIGAFRAATALWFPSTAKSEAYGLVQIEAMASRCPVINSDVPSSGVPWVSLDGQTGFTVPINDAAALARASQRLLDEPGLRERLANAAQRRAIDEFDHTAMAHRSAEVYRRVLHYRSSIARKPAKVRLSSWVKNFRRHSATIR